MAKELGRGGQIFFVHNRIEDLAEWAAKLRDLSPPGTRLAMAHGQMGEGELEKVMVDFVDARIDILVSTTIIESGLDIPRANTMIVNHADRFGLAQLYQMRGRIGRSRERAFCYLVVPHEGRMTPEAKQRLSVLQRFTELGAGFQVATHDLEIRGAGELLGDKQSGAVAAVGFETYARILEEAVAELKGEPIRHERDPASTSTGAWRAPLTRTTSAPPSSSSRIATARSPTRRVSSVTSWGRRSSSARSRLCRTSSGRPGWSCRWAPTRRSTLRA